MLFKRFSRSRSNSQSYVDSYQSPQDSKTNSASYEDARYSAQDRYGSGPVSAGSEPYDERREIPSSRQSNAISLADPSKETSVDNMYPRQSQPTEVSPMNVVSGSAYGTGEPRVTNGYGSSDGYEVVQVPTNTSSSKAMAGGDRGMSGGAAGAVGGSRNDTAAPDLLMQAFNQALRPHLDKVDAMEAEIADLRAYVDQLELQRNEVHAWIDKRGLRPDVPQSIAAQMDTASHANSPTHAAATLNAQLDRKITIVNFDLHRLQDDLNDSLPTPSFSACMLKFLPDISRLSSLPSGPRYAFDLLLKLGGNLNSHGGLENGDEEDIAERRAFYGRLDDAMVDVVRGRFKEEGDGWGVQREIKRIEKTGAYLRNWGVEPYFPQTLDVMRNETGQGAVAGASEGYT